MISNANMRGLLPLSGRGAAVVPSDLQRIIDRGWVIGECGELILADEPRPLSDVGSAPQESMAMELDINSFGIDSFDLVHGPESFLASILDRAFRFAQGALERAAGLPGAEALHAAVVTGVDDDFLTHGTKVRFYVHRNAIPAKYVDLDSYKLEAIALVGHADFDAEPGRIWA